MTTNPGTARLLRAARLAEERKTTTVRHKCFLSYHADDADEVAEFIERFDSVFIPKVIGVSADDDFIESDDDGYVLGKIQEKYMWDSTVTIVLIGRCTWARRFVDWEIYSSLRMDLRNKRNGLFAVRLPSQGTGNPALPARLSANLRKDQEDAFARYWIYPPSAATLQEHIEDAFSARATRAHLIAPAEARRTRNTSCP